ncbi:MAG TPA: GNAT family N-acetyltransferase, partial [Chloroflexota bacterium]|nr:GNAT family N-acetyltransferase [Chloroflexota bacterium]
GPALGGTALNGFEAETYRSSVIHPISDSRWAYFASRHPAATVFHQPAWLSAILDTFRYEPRFHVLENDRREIVAAWPTMLVRSRLTGSRLVCLPFCHRAGPLIVSEDQSERLFLALVEDARRLQVPSIEARDWPAGTSPPGLLQRVNLYRTHVLDLEPGREAVLSALHQGMRRSIRRSQRRGVTVRMATTRQDFETFYWLYVRQRKEQGVLPQPHQFMQLMYRNLLERGNGFLVLGEHEGSPVAGLLAVGHGTTATWTHSGAAAGARDLVAGPLVLWKSVEVACERGYSQFDLGRTAADDAGLLRYKQQWGVEVRDLPYYYYGRPSGANVVEPDGLRKLLLAGYTRVAPEPLLVALSLPMYRHLG